eukprot:5191549-Prymnesium_polylepis.1
MPPKAMKASKMASVCVVGSSGMPAPVVTRTAAGAQTHMYWLDYQFWGGALHASATNWVSRRTGPVVGRKVFVARPCHIRVEPGWKGDERRWVGVVMREDEEPDAADPVPREDQHHAELQQPHHSRVELRACAHPLCQLRVAQQPEKTEHLEELEQAEELAEAQQLAGAVVVVLATSLEALHDVIERDGRQQVHEEPRLE